MNSNQQNEPSGVPNTTGDRPAAHLSSRPAGPGARSEGGAQRPFTLLGMLDAFRRRWIPALAVAVPAALVVAGLLWQAVPAEYESSALLKVHQFDRSLVFDKQDATELINYQKSQINFIRSRPVLTSAVKVSGVRECRLLADMKHPVEWLEEELVVEGDFSDEFIRITLAGEIPEDLALIVNAVKDVYLDEAVFNARKEQIDKLKVLKNTFKQRDDTVRRNQERIAKLAEQLGTGDPKIAVVSMGLLQEKMQLLQAERRKLNSDIREEEALRAYLKERGLSASQISSSIPGLSARSSAIPRTDVSDEQTHMQKRLISVQSRIRQFRQNLKDKNHPELLALEQEEKDLRQLLNGLTASGNGDSGAAPSRYEWLIKQREKLDQEMKDTQEQLDVKGARIVELEKEQKSISHLVSTRNRLAEQIAVCEVELERPPRVTVIQNGNVPTKRDITRQIQAAVVGGMGTFGVIVAAFIMFEWFSYRVASASDITNAVNLRLLGTIPSPDRGGLLGLGIFAGKVNYDEWNRAVIESMDVVRTFLMRHVDPSRPASILVTSASANEGKTTVSCQLAASLARAGKRVALVDCDFRRPSAHLMLEGNVAPGICEYIRGEVALKDIRQQTQADGLTFIAAGQVDQTVLRHLSTDGGRSIIQSLKAEFDFVVIDTSPLLFVAEPSMLAQNADMVLLSTRKDYSRINYVAQSRDSLRSLQVPVVGAVMVGSDSDFQRQSYGYRQEIKREVAAPQQVGVNS